MNYSSQSKLTVESNINSFQKFFYYLYIFIVLMSFSPFKLIAYLLPFIFLLILILGWPADKLFRRSLVCLLIVGIIICCYGLIYPYVIIQNALLALTTYSSFIPIIAIPSFMLASDSLFQRILAFNHKLLLVEGTVGIIQAIYGFLKNGSFSGANGDYVDGTIHLSLEPGLAFSTPMFAVNMTLSCLLASVAVTKFQYKPHSLIIGIFSLILASVVHVFIFLILAIMVIITINLQFLNNPKNLLVFLFSTILIVSTSFSFVGGNFGLLPHFIEQAEDLQSPRSQITHETLFVIPKEYPAMPYIGLGPGQFSSRASLIGSGHYFGGFLNPTRLPLLTPATSAPMRKYLFPLWAKSAVIEYYGSTQQPYYSWLSIYSEFGLLGSLIVSSIVIFFLIKVQLMRIGHQKIWYKFTFQIGLLFLFFLGAQENYWEVAQVMFFGLIVLKLLYANILCRDTR